MTAVVRRRRGHMAAGMALLLAAVTGCGAATDNGGPGQGGEAAPVRLTVPDGFSTDQGWSSDTAAPKSDGTIGPAGLPVVAVASNAGVVATLSTSGEQVVAHRLRGGRAAWTFQTSVAMDDSRAAVFVQQQGGREVVVLARTGKVDGTVKTVVDVVDPGSKGHAKAVSHTAVERPASTGVEFAATPGGFMVGHGASRFGRGSYQAAAVVKDGEFRAVASPSVTVPPCSDAGCRMSTAPAFPTSRGVVSVFEQDTGCDRFAQGTGRACVQGFTVGSAWQSTSVAASGWNVAVPLAATNRHVIAAWQGSASQAEDPSTGSAETQFVVHDLATGKVLAQAACSSKKRMSLLPGGSQATTRQSPNGRFLTSGQVAFDLKRGKGTCVNDEAGNGITLSSVGDDGTAFGSVPAEGSAANGLTPYGALPAAGASPVQASVTKTAVELLPKAAVTPLQLEADGSGVFHDRDVVAVYPSQK